MTENADVKLGKVETALDTLIEEVRQLRECTTDLATRMTRLEESTRDAVSQVPTLREKVAQLEKETTVLRLEVENLKRASGTWSSRLWELAKMFLGPALASAGTAWLLMRAG